MATTNSDNWQVRIISTVAEIEDIRLVWESLQASESYPTINADIDRQLSVMQAFECTPLILMLEQNSQPRAIIIGRQQKLTIPVKLGYKTLIKPKLNGMVVVYGGVLGQPDEQLSSRFLQELAGILKQQKVDCIGFNHLPMETPFYRQIRREIPFLFRNHFPVIDLHWRMHIPESTDAFFQKLSKKHRANLRRTIRNFEDQYQGEIQIKIFDKNTDIDRLSRDAETVSTQTYQHGLGAGFLQGPLTKSILEADCKQNRLLFSILYVKEQPLAFQWGTLLRDTYFMEKIGYDPRWTRQGIGNILFIKNLDMLCSEHAAKYIDFGFGDASYKKSYGDIQWNEASAYVFAPRAYPIFINLFCTVIIAINIFLKSILTKSGMANKLKREWRNFLQKNETKDE